MLSINEKYKELYTSGARFFICTGGRGSSKSFSVSTWASMLLMAEAGHKVMFTRHTMTSAETSIIPEFLEKISLLDKEKEFNITKRDITNLASKSSIFFKGIKTSSGDQTAALKSLQGVTTWILDEAEEMVDEDLFDKINYSIRQKGVQNRVILILNPCTKEHWIYRRFFEDRGVQEGFCGTKGDTTYIHTSFLDNIDHLDESFIREAVRLKQTNPDRFKHIMLGGWLKKAEGVIFTNWKIGEFVEIDGQTGWGQDYGFSIDPTTLVRVSIDKVNKKIYVKEFLYKKGLKTSEIQYYNMKYAGEEVIYADSAEPRLIAELQAKGMNIKPVVKGKGSIIAGLTIMGNYEIIVDHSSLNIIKEFNNYAWADKKSNTPIDAYNHAVDAIRYCVFMLHRIAKRGFFAG